MAYTAWSVVYGEQPTAAKWNQLGANDAGFKDGTNLDNNFLITRHLGAAGVLQIPFVNLNKSSIGTSKRVTGSNVTGGSSGVTAASTTFDFISGQTYLITFSSQQCSSNDGGVWYSQLNVNAVALGTSRYSGVASVQQSAPITEVYVAASTATLTVSTTLHRASGSSTSNCEVPRIQIIPIVN